MKQIEEMSTLGGTPPSEEDAQLREIVFSYVLNETDPSRHGEAKAAIEAKLKEMGAV